MRKIDIADYIVSNTNLTKSQAIEAVDGVFNAIETAIAKGESVYVRGFATIKAYTTKPRKARNINKGVSVIIPAQRTAKLIVSSQLKARMNNK